MKVYASQIIVDVAGNVLRNAVVFSNPETNILQCADIFDGRHERAHTLFFDGIISLHALTNDFGTVPETDHIYQCNENELLPATFCLTEQTRLCICLDRPESLSRFVQHNYALLHAYPIPVLAKSMLLRNNANLQTSNLKTIAFLWQYTQLAQQMLSPETAIRMLEFL